MSQPLYRILDRKPHPVLQEIAKVRTCGSWWYFRCPKSGLEWHSNSHWVWADTPVDAWTNWFDTLMTRLQHWVIPDVHQRKRNSFSEFERMARCAREALDEVLRLRSELNNVDHLGTDHAGWG